MLFWNRSRPSCRKRHREPPPVQCGHRKKSSHLYFQSWIADMVASPRSTSTHTQHTGTLHRRYVHLDTSCMVWSHTMSPLILLCFTGHPFYLPTGMPSSETPQQINLSLPPLPPTAIREYSHMEENMYKDHLSTNLEKYFFFFLFFPRTTFLSCCCAVTPLISFPHALTMDKHRSEEARLMLVVSGVSLS